MVLERAQIASQGSSLSLGLPGRSFHESELSSTDASQKAPAGLNVVLLYGPPPTLVLCCAYRQSGHPSLI